MGEYKGRLHGTHKGYWIDETCRNIREDYMGHISGTDAWNL